MKTWKVFVTAKDDPDEKLQDTHVTAEGLDTAKDVQAYARKNWEHLRYVRCEDVTPPEAKVNDG